AGSGGAPAPSRPQAPAAPSTSVTDWAVAPIPGTTEASGGHVAPDAPQAQAVPPAQFAVDDEPEEAASASVRTATLAPAVEGAVLPASETAPVPDDADDEDDLDIVDPTEAPAPPVVPAPVRPAPGAVQRYGEAVVRQLLDARFVREEPYQAPTRFS
ncbi:MAG: DNA polymerase III subunit gamma and tau, partial [Microbacterium sp.]